MPLLAFLLVNIALGLTAAAMAARELRASPRSPVWTRGFAALALHQGLVAMPVLLYFLLRYGDWMVSYGINGGHLPSAVSLCLVVLHGALGLGGYDLGARWLRAHRPGRVPVAAGALVLLAAAGLAILHQRVGLVGSYVQYRGGFGLQSLGQSSALVALATLGSLGLLSAAHVVWSLRTRL